MEDKMRGQSRKASPAKKFKDSLKKALVYLVCVSLVGTNLLSSSAFAGVGNNNSGTGDVIVYVNNDGSVETGSNAVRSGGSGGGSGKVTGSSSVITAEEVESAANAKKTSDTVTYEEYADGILVIVEVPEGALPEDAELVVERYTEGSDEFAEAAEAIGHEADDENMAAVDIHFELDGEEVEPIKEVTVSIDVSDILPEDVDPETIEVTHLEEIKSEEDDVEEDEESEIAELSLAETAKKVKPVVVANKKKGEIDEETAVATFSVKSFSSFTITWGTGSSATEVTVYVYNVNGLGISDEDEMGTYEWASGTHTIADLISEHVTGKIGDGYTYAYATAGYLYDNNMGGGNVETIGSADDPVVSISWNGTNYTITTSSGSTTVASSTANEFYINLYFSTPTATISVTGADSTNHTVSLTANTEYFQNSDITYTWEITSGSEYASIAGSGANVTVTWNDGDEAGTDIMVKVTATSASGETATATYDLEYGMQQVTYTVYYDNGRTLAAGAHVAIYDEEGKLVSNGEADENGQVTLWIVPGSTYTLEASYTTSSGSGIQMTYTHYTYEVTEYVYSDGDETNIYLTTSDANFYEHVDVKLSIADEDAGYSDILANVDYVKIYDEAGELVYQSAEMVHNEGTNDYNVLFADADGNEGSNPHSIAFYDTYTIEIAYEVSYTYTDSSGNEIEYTESYVATIDKGSTYMDGEYYSYNGTNAYQLYNTIYGTDYTAATFATAVANQTLEDYNEHGISLDGLTYFYVAAALCDTKDQTGQAGLDLALGVNSLRRYSSTTWNFDVQKTLENSGADAGAFTFGLYDATLDENTWSINVSDNAEENGLNFTLSNGTMTMADGSTESVANMSGFFAFDYDSTMVGQIQTYYFVLLEDAGEDENITYSIAVYGIKVEVTLNSSTDMNDVTITETAYNLTESESSDEAYRTFTQGDEFGNDEEDKDEDGYTIFPFVNEYDAKGSVSFGVTKTISGRNTTAKSFTFALYETDEDFNYSAETLIKDQSTTGTLTENVAQSVVFDTDIEYTEGGTYYYVIKEVTSSGNGWTCDGTEYHITVTAANDGSGNIVPTEVTYNAVDSEGNTLSSGTLSADEETGVYGISGDSTLSFVNTYGDAEADVIFGGTKSITGTNSTTASFAFGLYETGTDFVVSDDSEVHATTVTGSGDFAFEEIDYTTAGTYYYVVKETTEDGSGWTVDGTEYHITVVVADATSDVGTGTFTITVSCTDAEGNTAELTQTQDEETEIYTFTGLNFTNEYDASGSLNLAATKEYTGATLNANQFNFTITETTDEEASNPYTETVTNDANGNITFTEISYTLDDVGTHTYEIMETNDEAGGVTYDSSTITVTVKVADAGDGTLTTTVTVDDREITAGTDAAYNVGTFNNKYEATGGVTLTATKEYTGADLAEGLFSFTITETSAGIEEENPYTETVKNDADGNITFTEIEYTLDDVGEHTYEITETNDEAGGVTYDSKTITVTVVVEDNGDGTLVATVTVAEESVTVGDDDSYKVGIFENSYEATGNLTLTATKTISGMSNTVKTFNFTLYDSNEDFTYGSEDSILGTAFISGFTEGVARTVTFPSITYTEAGTYYFVIVESSTGTEGDGWTYDGTKYYVTVAMEDDGEGNLIPTITYDYVNENDENQTANSANFTNSYKAAETSVQFAGTKYISNSTGTDKIFAFELYEIEDDSFDTTGVPPEEVKTNDSIDASGQSFEFSEITYEEAGTHYYVIKEQALDEANGWTISETVYYITVEVTDNLAGQLVATVSYVTEIGGDSTTVTGNEDDVYGGFDFTNTYAATGEVGLTALKSLNGRATSGTTFTFALYNSDEDFAEGSRIETQSTSNTIENSQEVSFTEIDYKYDLENNTYPMNYYYIIKETTTDGSGWTCDTGEYHVTVTVADDGTGTLTTSPSYVYVDADGEESEFPSDNATFTNLYAATGSLNLSGTKTFEGGTITDGQFTYTVMEGETQVATGTVAADGTITFTQIDYTYDEIGEHTYTITEDAGSDESVQYDDKEYTVVVTVTDNETGELNVSYTVNGEENGSIAFTNYQKGSLTISKAFTGLMEEQIASLTDFTITVTNSNGDTVATLTLDDADEDSSYTWTVSDLPAGTYTVTETGYGIDGYEVIVRFDQAEVTPDGSDASVDDTLAWGGEDTVAFTNDYTEVGSITITKYVVAEEDIQEAHEDTEYTVVITASEDADFRWVTVTSSLGREITPATDGKTITFTITENETVTIDGLPAGEYTVEEQGSDAMTSEHCVPTYIVGEEETEEAPTVTVASGSDNIVAVVIENEYPIGTYIMVQKDYNKDTYPEEGFTFTIEALSCDPEAEDVAIDAKDMPMPDNTTVTLTESGQIGYFGNIEYEHLGIYYYKITENAGDAENVDYDTSVHYIKVVVAATEGTYVETTDEYEAKVDEETDDYENLEYPEAGIVTAVFTNTAYDKLTIEKEVSGNAGDTSEYEFEITLTKDEEGYDGALSFADETDEDTDGIFARIANWFSGIIKLFRADDTEEIDEAGDDGTITFTDGKATITVKAGESVTLLIPSGWDCTITEITTGADTTTVYKNGEVIIQAKGTTAEAIAELGTVVDSTQVKFVNSYRSYFPIDEEIVTDTDDIFDRDAWVKDEAVNEYNAIEIEMTTNLPVVTAYDLENGEFTMNFHEVLDHELILDEDTADFSVYIGETAISTAYYRITFDDDTGDDCNFHVDVDLTALYNDGVVTEDMLDGNTEITVFFFADLEGTGLNGSYTSTIWYDIYDGEEWLYTSNESVVEVYTYEIEIQKYDA